MAKVASERQSLQLLISSTLNELDVFKKVQPMIESVMAQEATEVQMKQTIEHERTTTAAVRQLRNDLKDEKIDHDEKVGGSIQQFSVIQFYSNTKLVTSQSSFIV
jgi:hypothetical protein